MPHTVILGTQLKLTTETPGNNKMDKTVWQSGVGVRLLADTPGFLRLNVCLCYAFFSLKYMTGSEGNVWNTCWSRALDFLHG